MAKQKDQETATFFNTLVNHFEKLKVTVSGKQEILWLGGGTAIFLINLIKLVIFLFAGIILIKYTNL